MKSLFSLIAVVSISLTAFSQTSTNVQLISNDSAGYFLQKGLEEKGKGRRMESLKNFEKAAKYDSTSKEITTELASAYFDLYKYNLSRLMYKKLVAMGDETAATNEKLFTPVQS